MFKITIHSEKHDTVWLTKETQAEVDAYLAEIAETKHWGDLTPVDVDGNDLPSEYTYEVEDITAQVTQQQINETSLKYLADTDWIAIREFESGTPMPEDVREARATARASVVR